MERRASFETLEERMLLAADFGTPDVGTSSHDGSAETLLLNNYTLPQVFEGGQGYLSPSVIGSTPQDIAASYLQSNADDFELAASDFDDFRVLSETQSAHTRVTHLVMQQTYNGLDVNNAITSVHVDNDGRILAASSAFVGGLIDDPDITSFSPGISAQQAVQQMAGSFGLTLTSSLTIVGQDGTLNQSTTLSGGGISLYNIPAKLHYVPQAEGSVALSWSMAVRTVGNEHFYIASIDASDGSVNFANDWVNHAQYNVFARPTTDPDDNGQSIVVDPADSLASPWGWHDTDGQDGPEFTDTRGNNVFVQVGSAGAAPTVNGLRAQGGEDLEFLTDHDPLSAYSTEQNQDAGTANAFYWANLWHDMLVGYGFDEANGNFQANNYFGLGQDGDHIIIETQDPDAICGGFSLTVPEGFAGPTNQFVQLGFCNNALPARDGALDTTLVVHEITHGLSHRLVGGPTLNNGGAVSPVSQMRGMGEGWSDWMVLMMTQDINDEPEDPRLIGQYFFNGGIFPDGSDGIRRVPYSYDLSIDPLTFDNFNAQPDAISGADNNEVHNSGEIWASILWDLNWALIEEYGGKEVAFNENLHQAVGKTNAQFPIGGGMQGPDLLDLTTGANNLALQLVVDGMKLTPFAGRFTDARDGIVAADIALTGGVNLDVIWRTFARRGMGFSAYSGLTTADSNTNSAYDLPPTPADIQGTVFLDANENGVRDVNEIVLPGATIFLDLNQNGTRERLEPTRISDVDGKYNFVEYVGGTFTIRALPFETSFIQTLPDLTQIPGGPINDGAYHIALPFGDSASNIDFGFAPSDLALGIFGTKYQDLDGDGSQGPDEPGMEGVWIYVDIDGDQRIDFGEPADITKEDGSYGIDFFQPGNYAVREVVNPGWKQTQPGTGANVVNIIPGIPVIGVDFGNQAQDDYGDAPAPYPSLQADNGAVHGILPGFGMGTSPDADIDAFTGSEALGDDSNGIDDEDGVSINPDVFGADQPLVKGLTVSLNVSIANGTASAGVVQAWIDYNQDGDWDDVGEQILSDQTVVEGSNALTIDVPTTATVGLTFARFRYGYERGIGPTGRALVGEVEDHRLLILDDKPIANDDFFQVDQDTSNNQLDVLANDFASSLGPLTIRSIVATPDQGGAVSISADGSQIFYTPSANFSTPPLETFTYQVSDSVSVDCGLTPDRCDTATVQVDVTTTFPNAVAIDDYVDPVEGADVNPPITTIDVLANDIVGANGPLVLIPSGLTQPANGTTQVDVVNNTILYTPNGGFYNLDSFTYTASDTQNNITTANVSVQVSKPLGTCSPDADLANCDNVINFFVETLDPTTGASLTTVDVGQDFTVKVSVQDNRLPADALAGNGIFAGFMDVLYDAGNVQIKPSATPIVFSSFYPNFPQGDATVPGVVNELGALQNGFDPLGGGVIELASMTFVATGAGTATIQLDQADVSPEHDTLVHILNSQPSNDAVVDHTVINFGVVTLLVNSAGAGSGGGGGEGERLDASGDGYVTPMDALQVINDLNFYGARPLAAGAEGEMATPNSRFDVNGDDFISPSDVLAIITYLNNRSDGEGEAADLLSLLAEPVNVVATPEQVRSMMAPVDATSLVSEDRSDAPLVLPVQHAAITELPRQTAIETLTLSRWMTSSSDENVAGDDDLDSVLDSLADDVARQWHG